MIDNTQIMKYQKTITANNRKIKKMEDEINELQAVKRKLQSFQGNLDNSSSEILRKLSSISGKMRHRINPNFFSGIASVVKDTNYHKTVETIENNIRQTDQKINQNKQEINRLKKQQQNCHAMIQKAKSQMEG